MRKVNESEGRRSPKHHERRESWRRREIGMAIFFDLVDSQPGPTLIGQIKLDSTNLQMGMGFIYKTQLRFWSGMGSNMRKSKPDPIINP